MLLVVKDQTIIHLIRQTKDVKLDTKFRNLGQLFSGKDLADGVVWGIDNDRFGL